jgi:thioredoxin 2
MNIVCHQCSSLNRVPEDRLLDHPVCGKCKKPLIPLHPIELSDANFDQYIHRTEVPVIVDFWAEWCAPCKMMAPQFLQASEMMNGIVFAKVDTEANSKTSVKYFIRSIPTLILFKNGEVIAKQSGALTSRDLVRWLEGNLK